MDILYKMHRQGTEQLIHKTFDSGKYLIKQLKGKHTKCTIAQLRDREAF